MDTSFLYLYDAPFRWDGICYIHDAKGNMVADFLNDYIGRGFRIRGYGRLRSEFGGELADKLHDNLELHLPSIISGHEKDPEKCVELLNAFWKAHES